MDLVHSVLGSQQVGFARCRGTAANVNAAGGALGCHDYGATSAGLLVRVVAKAKAIDIANVNGLKQCIHVLLLSVFRRALCPVGIRTVRRNCRRWGIPSANAITIVFESRVRRERWAGPPRCRSRPKYYARACARRRPGCRRRRPCPWARPRRRSAQSARR